MTLISIKKAWTKFQTWWWCINFRALCLTVASARRVSRQGGTGIFTSVAISRHPLEIGFCVQWFSTRRICHKFQSHGLAEVSAERLGSLCNEDRGQLSRGCGAPATRQHFQATPDGTVLKVVDAHRQTCTKERCSKLHDLPPALAVSDNCRSFIRGVGWR